VYIRRLDADSSGTVARRQTRRPCRSLYVRQNKHKSGSAQGCQRTALCAKKQRGLIYLGFCTGVDDVATLCDISDPTLFECVQSRAVTSCVPNETVMCVCVVQGHVQFIYFISRTGVVVVAHFGDTAHLCDIKANLKT